MDWFCIVQGEQRGPLGADEMRALIRAGTLGPGDYVWTAAFGETWKQLRDVPDLHAAPAQAPAAQKPEVDAQPAFDTPLSGVTGRCPHFREAVHGAWDRMVSILFRPGDPVRWLSIGFCAWISVFSLMGGGIDLPTPKAALARFQDAPSLETLRSAYVQSYEQFLGQLHASSVPFPLILTTVAVLLVAWSLFSAWLRARGAFMVLHRWHQPEATIAQSWAAGRGLGRSLFLFRLLFGAAMLALLALIGAGVAFSIVLPLMAGVGWNEHIMLWILIWLLVLLVDVSVWGTVLLLLNEWVAPVMYWRRVGVMAAWRTVLDFCNERPGSVIIYLTLYPLVWLAAMMAVLAVCLCTCCIACVGLFIPYVSAVLLLPVILFLRGIGIVFLRQWRPDLAGR